MIIEDFNEQYKISKGQIMKKERNTELKIGGIGICLFSIMVFLFTSSKDGWNELTIGFCILVTAVLIIAAPFRLIILHKNYKRCPENIRCQWDHLWIGEQHYSFSDLKILEITSPKIESHSIYPVQHYIYVISNSRKDIYWLGSTASLSIQEYYKLCNTMEKMFLQYPEKFKYANKGSLMSK